ncbi:MAG: hypothetical protein ACJAZP_003570 [Psychromonas sp.]|jgi:hypothetical protein
MKQKIVNISREIAGIFIMFAVTVAIVLLQASVWM